MVVPTVPAVDITVVELTENDKQGSSSMEDSVAISLPTLHSGERPTSEASDSSNLHSYRCSSATASPSSTSSATGSNLLSLDKPNQPDESVIPAQKLTS